MSAGIKGIKITKDLVQNMNRIAFRVGFTLVLALILATGVFVPNSFNSTPFTLNTASGATTDEDVSVIVKDDQNNEICTLDTDAEKCDLSAEEYGEGIIALDLKNKVIQLNGVNAPETVVSFSNSLSLKGDSAILAGVQQVDSSQTTTFESGTYKFASAQGAGLDIAGALIVKPEVSITAIGSSSGVYAAGNIILEENTRLTGITTSPKGVGVIGNGISVSTGTVLEGRSNINTLEPGFDPSKDDTLTLNADLGEDNTTVGIAVGWGNALVGGGNENGKAKIKAFAHTGISLNYPEDDSYPEGDVSLINTDIDIIANGGTGVDAKQVDLDSGTQVNIQDAASGIYARGNLTLKSVTFSAKNVMGGLYSDQEIQLQGSAKVNILSYLYGILAAKKVAVNDQSEVDIKTAAPPVAPTADGQGDEAAGTSAGSTPDDSVDTEGSTENATVSWILGKVSPYTGLSAGQEVYINLIEEGYLNVEGKTISNNDPNAEAIPDASDTERFVQSIDVTGSAAPTEAPTEAPAETPHETFSGAAISCGDTTLVQSVDPSTIPAPAPEAPATPDASDSPTPGVDGADPSTTPAATPDVSTPELAPNAALDCNITIGAKTKMEPATVSHDDAGTQSFIKAVYAQNSPAATVKITAVPVPWFVSLWRMLGIFLILIILLIVVLISWLLFLMIHKKPTLLVMNLQNATINDNVYKLALDSTSREGLVKRIESYIKKYRRRFKKIILSQEVHGNNSGVMEHFHTWGEHALAGTPGAELVSSVKPLQELKNAVVLITGESDDGYNAFAGTVKLEGKEGAETLALIDVLKKFKVKRVKVIGLPLDYAILKTALEGVALLGERKVEVLTNLTASVTDRDKIIAKMREKGIVVK